jgi:hypothetical protein
MGMKKSCQEQDNKDGTNHASEYGIGDFTHQVRFAFY